MDSWIPCMLGVRVLMASGSALIHRNWCEKWLNKYKRSRRRLTQFCPNQYTHLLVMWQLSNHFCLGVVPRHCVTTDTFRERGWLCLMYIVYHVYSDSILCKRDLFFFKSLCFFIMRFYEAGMLGVCLATRTACLIFVEVWIEVEKERERSQ